MYLVVRPGVDAAGQSIVSEGLEYIEGNKTTDLVETEFYGNPETIQMHRFQQLGDAGNGYYYVTHGVGTTIHGILDEYCGVKVYNFDSRDDMINAANTGDINIGSGDPPNKLTLASASDVITAAETIEYATQKLLENDDAKIWPAITNKSVNMASKDGMVQLNGALKTLADTIPTIDWVKKIEGAGRANRYAGSLQIDNHIGGKQVINLPDYSHRNNIEYYGIDDYNSFRKSNYNNYSGDLFFRKKPVLSNQIVMIDEYTTCGQPPDISYSLQSSHMYNINLDIANSGASATIFKLSGIKEGVGYYCYFNYAITTNTFSFEVKNHLRFMIVDSDTMEEYLNNFSGTIEALKNDDNEDESDVYSRYNNDIMSWGIGRDIYIIEEDEESGEHKTYYNGMKEALYRNTDPHYVYEKFTIKHKDATVGENVNAYLIILNDSVLPINAALRIQDFAIFESSPAVIVQELVYQDSSGWRSFGNSNSGSGGDGSGGDHVSIVPTYMSGSKIADYAVNDASGAIYMPEIKITPIQTSGTPIATIKIGDTEYTLYSPTEGGGGEEDMPMIVEFTDISRAEYDTIDVEVTNDDYTLISDPNA